MEVDPHRHQTTSARQLRQQQLTQMEKNKEKKRHGRRSDGGHCKQTSTSIYHRHENHGRKCNQIIKWKTAFQTLWLACDTITSKDV